MGTATKTIGVIGGSGLYKLDALENMEFIDVNTPFGSPSDQVIAGNIGETRLLFIPRHGRGHRYLPTEIPYRANIWALKSLGAQWVVGVSAVGSLKMEIEPGHVVIPDQFFDLTRQRVNTFFGDGCVAHVSVADPICGCLAEHLASSAGNVGISHHRGGTYVCMEGPAFSTRAESRIYRSWGMDVIGMTNMPEAKLAREAEMCFATLALATDYDCWHETEDDVSAEGVIEIMKGNTERAGRILTELAHRLSSERNCSCPTALKGSIMTDLRVVPASTRQKLDLLVGHYFQECEKQKG